MMILQVMDDLMRSSSVHCIGGEIFSSGLGLVKPMPATHTSCIEVFEKLMSSCLLPYHLRGRGTHYERPHGDVPPTWVAK